MKVTIEKDNGEVTVYEGVLDYAIIDLELLKFSVNTVMESDNAWDGMSKAVQDSVIDLVSKAIMDYDGLVDFDELCDESRNALVELGIHP